jgi:putative endonuclease
MERKQYGNEAESRAVEFLEAEGYVIRDRNVSYRYGELDVVAEKDGVLCFVEVRMRSSGVNGEPQLTVMSVKQHKVVKAAMGYLQRHRLMGRTMVRFDVIAVTGRGASAQLEHIPNAFDAGF